MASGSLDSMVVIWQVSTGQMLYKHDFGGSTVWVVSRTSNCSGRTTLLVRQRDVLG